jgi:hypothetical protein
MNADRSPYGYGVRSSLLSEGLSVRWPAVTGLPAANVVLVWLPAFAVKVKVKVKVVWEVGHFP